jgi:RNA methyltransferase, TrmH family
MVRLGVRHRRVQRLRRLIRRASVRQSEHAFVAEGTKVVLTALDAKAPVESIFLAPDWGEVAHVAQVVETASRAGIRIFELGAGVMERVADTVTPQPVCAIVGNVDVDLDGLFRVAAGTTVAPPDLVVVCMNVRDPGNLGAVIRSAAAAGRGAVVCCPGTVDPYNPKAVRASAGAIFHVPLVIDAAQGTVLDRLRTEGFRCWATAPQGGENYTAAPLDGRSAIVLGNEAGGLEEEVVSSLDGSLSIPMADGAESLNVAMTAAVLCFEVARRRASLT